MSWRIARPYRPAWRSANTWRLPMLSSATRKRRSPTACWTVSPICCGRRRWSRGVGNRAPLPGEFALIRKYFAPLAAGFSGALDLEDDAATYAVPSGCELVLTADALVEGRHYLAADPADLVARKMLRVNLSDLAAKGAKPVGYLMTTALGPDIDEDWIAKFAAGLDADQKEYGISLMGGDTVATPGPTTLSLTALGLVPTGRALRRRGAKPGDRLFVSGTIGDGILGLKVLKGELFDLSADQRDALADRYHLPQPRLALGATLLAGGKVTAAMDVSD